MIRNLFREQPEASAQFLKLFIKRAALFSCLWVILTSGETTSWLIGAWVVPLAAILSIRLFHAESATQFYRLNLFRLFGFAPFFLWQSLRGGWTTARLALLPNMSITPKMILYKTQLPSGSPQNFFLSLVSLLPGTVSVECRDSTTTIHALDGQGISDDLQTCERKVAELFGLELNSSPTDIVYSGNMEGSR